MRKKKEPTVVDVLRRMRAILRKGWTQGYFAKTKTGKFTHTESRSAVSFCLVGARSRAEFELKARRSGALDLIEQCIPNRSDPTSFNDKAGRKKSEIIAVVNCAIKKAEAQR